MPTPFIGEIKIISWNFPPKGWTFCNGQLLPINQNQALFSLLGTTYGGNGQTTFGLPNLQGHVPTHIGNGFTLGERSGETAHTLNISELPAHNHSVGTATKATAGSASPNGNLLGGANNAYHQRQGAPLTNFTSGTVTNIGGSQPHENMPPYLVLNFIIALQGVFPSQN